MSGSSDPGGRTSGPFLAPAVAGVRGGYRPYFENYTVDASIFLSRLRSVHIDDLKDH